MKSIPFDRAELSLHPQASLKWLYEQIPYSLANLPQWRLCYPPNYIDPETRQPIQTLKRPIYGPIISQTSPGYLLSQVTTAIDLTTSTIQHFGLCLIKENAIIGIDVDSLPENFTEDDLPPNIKLLLKISQEQTDTRKRYNSLLSLFTVSNLSTT